MSMLLSREKLLTHARQWGHQKDFESRDFLIRHTEVRPALWVIERGRVLVTVGKGHASHHVIGLGDILPHHMHSLPLSAEALEPTRAWEIPLHVLSMWREKHPELFHSFNAHAEEHTAQHLKNTLHIGESLLSLLVSLSATSTLQELGRVSLDQVYSLIPSRRRALFHVDTPLQKVHVIQHVGFDDVAHGKSFSLPTLMGSESTLGEVMRTSTILRRTQKHMPTLTGFFERPEIIIAPLGLENRVLGAILLADPETPYNVQHEKILEGVAASLAAHLGRILLQEKAVARSQYRRRSLSEIRSI